LRILALRPVENKASDMLHTFNHIVFVEVYRIPFNGHDLLPSVLPFQ
jgi:hypothetical protein